MSCPGYANDLNPKSVEYLRGNKDRNRCGDLLDVRGPGCARDFLRGLVAEGLRPTHAIYNLPASGIEQGSKRVIKRRFNVSVPRARVSETAPTLRERSER